MNYIDLFLPHSASKPLIKPRFVAVEADWTFLCTVFPEPGFRSYFLGHIVSQLAKELKQHGITDYHERADRPDLANISRFLSHIRLTRETYNTDDGRGIGRTCDEDADGEGESASNAIPVSGEDEEGKDDKSCEETRP